MAEEMDRPGWLPEPPPPRPARREAAIEAALRRFDGVEDAAPSARKGPRRPWVSTYRPQLALALSAMLLVVIGVPAALIGIRNESAPPVQQPPRPAAREVAQAPAANRAPETAESPAPAPRPPLALRKDQGADRGPAPNVQPVAAAAPPAPTAPIAAAAPPPAPRPPPPPPPPAPAPPSAATAGERSMTQELVVTGSRIAQPALEAPNSAKVMRAEQPYAAFLSRLKAAVRGSDRGALIALVAFPLRVNFPEGARIYRDAPSLGRDFDRVFTPKVKRAVLEQRPEHLSVRGQGAMVGEGELWLRETCPNSSCSPAGPVRIVAVNP
jgi:hypothetical protein